MATDPMKAKAKLHRGSLAMTLVFSGLGTTLMVFLVGPLMAVLFSQPYQTLEMGLADAALLRALGVSFLCAGIAICLAVLLGAPLAYLLARRTFPGKSIVRALLSLPLVIPHPVVGIALLLVFARHRLLGSLLEGTFGVAIVGAIPGVVLAMLFVSSPLVVRSVEEGLHGLDPRVEQAAESLGASAIQTFFHVTLPYIRPAIAAGTAAGLARAVSEFGSIAVIAYFPKTAPVLIWDRFTAYGLRGALPATALLLGISLTLFLVWSYFERRRRH